MYLEKINSPKDLKKLSVEELKVLCAEIRTYMVDECSRNPGHLASSLGAVELIVGIHYVYDTPSDKLVFDVGHQAYAHKILTGRYEAFKTLRTEGGLSGFPRRCESEYDAFGAGHSSTSISAALGFAEAARMKGESYKSIAFIGDGALTGGLALEALNNAGDSDADLLVVLNDNNQSISKNLGGLHSYLLQLTSSRGYNNIKDAVWNSLGENRFRQFLQRWIRSLKSWFVKKSGGDLFEALGVRYFGLVDGNDISAVVSALEKMRQIRGPHILHCTSVKGKGYAPAESDPVVWHAPGKFNPESGERVLSKSADRFQDVFGQTLCDLADQNSDVVGITPAMATGCGMDLFAQRHPDRFFDVGIEEEHAVTFSAGLAAAGMKPFCNIYSAFSQRAYDQIIHDVALQHLPVVLCFDRAGLVGEDGATHHGLFDMAAYRSIPGITIASPKDSLELRQLMYTAHEFADGPFIIRYPRGGGKEIEWRSVPFEKYEIGKAECLVEGGEIAVIATGPCSDVAVEAASKMPGKMGVYHFRFVKPLDTEMLSKIVDTYKYIITVEDGCLNGGLYGAVCEYVSATGQKVRVKGLGVPDEFVEHGKQADQRNFVGITTEGILAEVEKLQ